MSEPPLSVLRALVASMIWLPSSAGRLAAQLPANDDSSLARIRSLDSVVAVRKSTLDSIRRSHVRAIPSVAVTSGALTVRTSPELESRVRGAVALSSQLVADAGSPTLLPRITNRLPVVMRDSTPVALGFVPVISIAPDTTRRWYATMRVTVPVTASAPDIADRLSMFVEQFAFQNVDSSLAAWAMMGRAPLRPTSAENARDVYVELATGESAAARRCRSGETDACLEAFGLDSSSGSRLNRWYSPEDYHSLLLRVAPPRDDSAAVAAWVRCRDDREQGACAAAAHALPDSSVPFPFSGSARLMLLRQAFELGGAGAYDRLVMTNGSVRGRIEAAAGKPMDVIVQRWLASVEAARPNPMKLRASMAAASLGWCGLLLAVGITRRRSCA